MMCHALVSPTFSPTSSPISSATLPHPPVIREGVFLFHASANHGHYQGFFSAEVIAQGSQGTGRSARGRRTRASCRGKTPPRRSRYLSQQRRQGGTSAQQ